VNDDPVLVVTELTKTYRGRPPKTAVDRVSFVLNPGEILGLLGPNGAGKTTTIQMLLSTLKPSSGQIAYFGKPLDRYREDVLGRVGFASGFSRLPFRLSVAENLDVFGRLHGLPRAERKARSEELLRAFGVWNLRNRLIAGLSSGEMTRVLLAKAFLARPSVVLLDEPTASLDPEIAHEVRRFLRDRRDGEGLSMVYTSHNMDEVAEVCDRVIFLGGGRIVSVGRPEDLAAEAASTRVSLRVEHGLAHLVSHASARDLPCAVDGQEVQIEIDERHVAGLLSAIGAAGVAYSRIALHKPTLEDYFLKLAAARSVAVSGNGDGKEAP
jgi:ABC-2 type transport system ATP-binding protein